ncbi:hypothetical protein KGA66_04835 [Actinocrinis puniceicyclus]|uniref:Ketosynthase family 3 (KS3) domain-containing protein n=1 Tax=Actinocrinis puniceicyclus TaxID=977794 RepID=A0A8J8BBR6_9ACTN|nr:beta-ketoacyl synthase N-terminal-like domain-containing protein [Actinocrinis puniceicyclus]MBS2962361.1 hypothetical protein [Actinocrinis puniceicyclus]
MNPVITGAGLVSSLGADVRAAFAEYCRGAQAVHPLRAFDPARYRVKNAYEIDDRPPGGADEPARASRWLREAVRQALADAALPAGSRVPLVIGTGLGEQRSLELWRTAGAEVTADRLAFGPLPGELGLGHHVTLVNACSAGLFALAVGADLLELGAADAVVVAAVDAISESMFGLLDRVNARPPSHVAPFDEDRVGVVLGEGAAAIVLEHPTAARHRSAAPLAVLRAVATCCDAHHSTAPHQPGLVRALREALRRAGLSPRQVDLIMAHGTGTLLNDATEAAALGEVFGDALGEPLVTALKSLTGHTSGASGLMSLVVATEALRTGLVPPTANLVKPIAQAAGMRFAVEPVVEPAGGGHGDAHGGGAPLSDAPLDIAQIDAFGFGGLNAVALIERPRAAAGLPAAQAAARATTRTTTRVAVTGIGLELPSAANCRSLLELARGGVSLAAGAPPPPFESSDVVGPRGLRYHERATRLALSAAARALAAAGLSAPEPDIAQSAGFGVAVATDFSIAEKVCRVTELIHALGVEQTSPMDLPNVSGNVVAASLAIWYRLGGHNLTVSSGAPSGVDAVRLAADAIRAGRARRMLVVGVEPAEPAVAELLARTAARRDPGSPAPGLFDGAVAVVVEDLDLVRERAGRPLALLGEYRAAASLAAALPAPAPAPKPAPDAAANAAPGASSFARVWFPPCPHHDSAAADRAAAREALERGAAAAHRPHPVSQGLDSIDLGAVLGETSAALGVLQCAAAAEWLALSPADTAVIASGGCWGADFAALSLTGAR